MRAENSGHARWGGGQGNGIGRNDVSLDRADIECVPGAGANGNIMALHTAEWLKPKARPNSWVRMDSRSYDFVWVPSACGVAKDVSESPGLK